MRPDQPLKPLADLTGHNNAPRHIAASCHLCVHLRMDKIERHIGRGELSFGQFEMGGQCAVIRVEHDILSIPPGNPVFVPDSQPQGVDRLIAVRCELSGPVGWSLLVDVSGTALMRDRTRE
jgi:hypothetical protein